MIIKNREAIQQKIDETTKQIIYLYDGQAMIVEYVCKGPSGYDKYGKLKSLLIRFVQNLEKINLTEVAPSNLQKQNALLQAKLSQLNAYVSDLQKKIQDLNEVKRINHSRVIELFKAYQQAKYVYQEEIRQLQSIIYEKDIKNDKIKIQILDDSRSSLQREWIQLIQCPIDKALTKHSLFSDSISYPQHLFQRKCLKEYNQKITKIETNKLLITKLNQKIKELEIICTKLQKQNLSLQKQKEKSEKQCGLKIQQIQKLAKNQKLLQQRISQKNKVINDLLNLIEKKSKQQNKE